MASPIPTFRSNATSQAGNFGIVQQTGTRAMANSSFEGADSIKAVTDFARKKMYERMEEEQKRVGIEAVQDAGFDPMSLGEDPVTTADKIYRQSAMSAYTIQLKNDIESNLSRMEIANKFNPKGFSASANAYLKTTASKVPTELQRAIESIGGNMAVKKYASISKATQTKVLKEASDVMKLQEDRLLSRYKQEDGDGREDVLVEASALYRENPAYMTPELKREAFLSFARKADIEASKHEIMMGRDNPVEVVERLEKEGIAVSLEDFNSLFNVAGTRDNYLSAQKNKQKAEMKAKQTQWQTEKVYEAMEVADTATFDEMEQYLKGVLLEAREQGVSGEDAFAFVENIRKYTETEIETDDLIYQQITTAIKNGNPRTREMIQNASIYGKLTKADAEKLSREYDVQTSDVMTTIAGRELKQMLNNKFPTLEGSMDTLPVFEARQIQQENFINKQARNEAEHEFVQRVEEGENPTAVFNEIRQRIGGGETRNNRGRFLGYGAKVNSMLSNMANGSFDVIFAKRVESENILLGATRDVNSMTFEPLSRENAGKVYEVMKFSNKQHEEKGLPVKYPEEVLQAIYNEFIKPESKE